MSLVSCHMFNMGCAPVNYTCLVSSVMSVVLLLLVSFLLFFFLLSFLFFVFCLMSPVSCHLLYVYVVLLYLI